MPAPTPSSLRERVANVAEAVDRDAFRQALVARQFCEDHDLRDVSLLPLVISRQEHARHTADARRLCRAALGAFAKRLDPARFVGDPFQSLLQRLPLRQRVLCGNARFDFLPRQGALRLVELNFVGVGTTARPHRSAEALLDCLPELGDELEPLRPVDAFARQLKRHGVRSLVLLTKDNDREYGTPWLDRLLVARHLGPAEVTIVPRSDWGRFTRHDGRLLLDGRPVDAIYPRELTWRPSIEEGIDWIHFFLEAGPPCFDHWALILLEDKDLRHLALHDPAVGDLLPGTWDAEDPPVGVPLSELVLKRRHDHGGEGVQVGPKALPAEDRAEWLLQERIRADRREVNTLLGFRGRVVHDLAIHVCYDYDLERCELIHCEVSGYLSRFAPEGDVVNLAQGGGVIPVLLESVS
jgi:hypothetical protein